MWIPGGSVVVVVGGRKENKVIILIVCYYGATHPLDTCFTCSLYIYKVFLYSYMLLTVMKMPPCTCKAKGKSFMCIISDLSTNQHTVTTVESF
jgi:hypothetical protein